MTTLKPLIIENMKHLFAIVICLSGLLFLACNPTENEDIFGFDLLNDVSGHWVGSNETAYGFFEWFTFDFRPISGSHTHSIYEGGTNENIITSFFVAEFGGSKQIMARNGGWLGNQYRATYFVLDRAETTSNGKYYRLVDAVGGVNRSYMELRFEQDTFYFDAYKDNGGSLDEAVHHMGFKGVNYNPDFAETVSTLFDFPTNNVEVNLTDAFNSLIDNDSALFLEESLDPFPKTDHGHLSDLSINIQRSNQIPNSRLLLYVSSEPIIDADLNVDLIAVDRKVVRTISIAPEEEQYILTYLHPDNYYITMFEDRDGNFFPSAGDYTSISKNKLVPAESNGTMDLVVDNQL